MNDTRCALSSLQQNMQQLEHSAQLDTLTEVLNRRGAEERLDLMIDNAATISEQTLVLFIDLDQFKQINDVHGHQTGDRVLQIVGRVLRANLRQNDWVSRWGGDEFLLVLTNSYADYVGKLTQRLLDQLDEVTIDKATGLQLSIGFSVGAAVVGHQSTRSSILQAADQAMYQAKHTPGIRYVVSDSI